ncbi:hypothetical protein ACS0TY_000896 [Phlomoides rotata]
MKNEDSSDYGDRREKVREGNSAMTTREERGERKMRKSNFQSERYFGQITMYFLDLLAKNKVD